ncbi:uncharacterized protein DEA37_0004454 [Paragonimus westermani]|uniref:Uncharacterized protein n=1 Tax=Paragonimus westermani TaxID=34504 RepID=A0A5J4NR33_9TREM|nr:uncharacterized protein DEA37_0004454 [Paragonimus westermani]
MDNTKTVGLGVPLDNIIAKDQIWKDHCQNEANATKLWYKNWSFLTKTQEELLKDEKENLIDPHREKPEIPAHLKVTEAVPISDYIKIKPSPVPIPQTTSGFIGWRSGKEEYLLEKYAQKRSPQGCLLRRFHWPVEAIW